MWTFDKTNPFAMDFSTEDLPPGSIAFLKPDAHERDPDAFEQSGLDKDALGHPALILGVSSSDTEEDVRVWIMLITSSVTPPRSKHLLPIRSSNPLIHKETDIFHNSNKSIFHASLEAYMPAQSYVQPRQVYDVSVEILRPFRLWTPDHFTLTEQSMLSIFESRSVGLENHHRKLWKELLDKYQDYNAIERHESDADWSPTLWIGQCFWLGHIKGTHEKQTALAWLTPCVCIFLRPEKDSQDCIVFPILATDRLLELEKARSRYLLDRRGLISDYRKSESKLVHKCDTRWVTRGVECKTNFLRDFAVAHRTLLQIPMNNLEYLPEAHPLHSFSLPETDLAELYEISDEVSPPQGCLLKKETPANDKDIEGEVLASENSVQSNVSIAPDPTTTDEGRDACGTKEEKTTEVSTKISQLGCSEKSVKLQDEGSNTILSNDSIEVRMKVKDLKINTPLENVTVTINTST